MKKQRELILLTGLPATGKTKTGAYLQNKYGFLHINFEVGASKQQFEENPEKFFKSIEKQQKVVITWGFMPVKRNLLLVEFLTANKFKHIWFHANYFSSLITFIKRDQIGNLASFFWQVGGIFFSQITKDKSLKIIYPYKSWQKFKDPQEIAKEISI